MDAAVGAVLRAREDPLARVPVELASEDLLRLAAEDHRARLRLRLRQHQDALLQVDLLATERADLAEPHERERRESGHRRERQRPAARFLRGLRGLLHRLEHDQLLLGAEPAHARGVLLGDGTAREAELGADHLDRGAERRQVAVDAARRERRPPRRPLPGDDLGLALALAGPDESKDVVVADRAHGPVE